jgi:hypothetical protein
MPSQVVYHIRFLVKLWYSMNLSPNIQTAKAGLLRVLFAIVVLNKNSPASESLGTLMNNLLPIPQAVHLEYKQIFARLPADRITREVPNRLHLTK